MTRDTEHIEGSAGGTRLTRLAGELHALLERIDELSRRQGALIDEADAAPLLEVLDERRALVEGVDRLAAQIERLRSACEAHASAALRDEVRRRLDGAAALAAAITRRDEQDGARLRQRRDELAERLVEIERGRGALAAYGRRDSEGPTFQDAEA